jgi:hypothetical protein
MDLELLAGLAVGFWAAHQVTQGYNRVREELEEYKAEFGEALGQVQAQRQALVEQGMEMLAPGANEQTGASNEMQGSRRGIRGSHSYMGRGPYSYVGY